MSKVILGDCLKVVRGMADNSVDCVITSPPYWCLRDYGHSDQLGLEKTPQEYVTNLVKLFDEVKRVLKKGGTLWLNLGDSYIGGNFRYGTDDLGNSKQSTNRGSRIIAETKKRPNIPKGFKSKDLAGIPWRVAFALQADGWYLRQDIIWAKPNPMPESVTDRCTKSHEYIFLLTKNPKYYFDNEIIMETATSQQGKGAIGRGKQAGAKAYLGQPQSDHSGWISKTGKNLRNKRSVWSVTTKPFKEAHFATFPEKLIEPMVLAGCPENGTVLDPFFGAGTTGLVAKKLNRNYIGIEINPEYVKIAQDRLKQEVLL